ncbi:MgtC/SapB family protein [Mucilaginibacter sp.]
MVAEEFHVAYHDLIKIGFAMLFGGVLGLERQYKHKTAGFRTIILICLGSALFTLVAQKGGTNVNANVITGIGFIGAGVIFKEGFTVSGLTTAAVIWISAAIGVAVGTGDYTLALIATAVTVIVLSLLSRVEDYINTIHGKKIFSLVFTSTDYHNIEAFETMARKYSLTTERRSVTKKDANLQALIEVAGHIDNINKLNEELVLSPIIKSF